MTDTGKNNVSKFVWKPFKSPLSLKNENENHENVSVRHLSLICITSFLTTIYSLKIVQFMEDLAVFTALNHSGSFGKNFFKLKKKICYLPAKGWSVW